MSQTTLVEPTTMDSVCVQAPPSSSGKQYYLTLRGDGTAIKPSHPATDTSQDGPCKASLKKALAKTRNWMAHIFSWQSVKVFFEKAFNKTSNFLAHIISMQNVDNAAIFYEEKGHDVGTACKQAGRSIYKRATAPRDITPSGRKCSTKSWVAKKAKVAVRTAVNAFRILGATAQMGIDAALGAVETAGAGALYALDSLCEEE